MRFGFLISIIFVGFLSCAWNFPGTRSSIVASQDVVAASADTHDVGTSSNGWKNGYFQYMRFSSVSDVPSNVASKGVLFVKESDKNLYYRDPSGTEAQITSL